MGDRRSGATLTFGDSRAQHLAVALLLTVLLAPPAGQAAQTWGGSIALTSDYLVRGISRSNHEFAIQADVHVASAGGLLGGLFASTARFGPDDPRDVELDAFFGYAWDARSDWRTKILVSHYSYPWIDSGSKYSYDELNLDAVVDEWLDLSALYSPNAPRYVPEVRGLIGVWEKTVEVNVRTPWPKRLVGTVGIGYSDYGGPDGAGYAYWSVGALYSLAPVSFAVSYVNTSSAAKYLFYNAAAHNRWAATVIWQF